MKLSEIAELIVERNPECRMAYNKNVIKGCRDSWYEESLIDPLMDYYMYTELKLCRCGIPEDTYEVMRRYLHIRDDMVTNKLQCKDVVERYKTDLHIDDNDSLQAGLLQFMMYMLDEHECTEHGSSIGGCWLTDKGRRLLTVLDAWHNSENNKLEK